MSHQIAEKFLRGTGFRIMKASDDYRLLSNHERGKPHRAGEPPIDVHMGMHEAGGDAGPFAIIDLYKTAHDGRKLTVTARPNRGFSIAGEDVNDSHLAFALQQARKLRRLMEQHQAASKHQAKRS